MVVDCCQDDAFWEELEGVSSHELLVVYLLAVSLPFSLWTLSSRVFCFQVRNVVYPLKCENLDLEKDTARIGDVFSSWGSM